MPLNPPRRSAPLPILRTKKGTRRYIFQLDLKECVPDSLSFQASIYQLVGGVRTCNVDATPAQVRLTDNEDEIARVSLRSAVIHIHTATTYH